jgi:hypothetical protein
MVSDLIPDRPILHPMRQSYNPTTLIVAGYDAHDLVIPHNRGLRWPLPMVHRLQALAIMAIITTTTVVVGPRLTRRVTESAGSIRPSARQTCGVVVRTLNAVVPSGKSVGQLELAGLLVGETLLALNL